MHGLNGSAIKYISALSPTTFTDAGSSNAFNIGAARWLNVLVHSDSAEAVFNVERAGASNGTFAQVGLSIQATASQLVVRGMPLQSSAVWYRVTYDNEGAAGSALASVIFEVQGHSPVPVEQDSNTTVLSDVLV